MIPIYTKTNSETGEVKTFTKIENLYNWEENPRGIKTEDFELLKQSLREEGQTEPLLSTHEGQILGGNMRLRAMLEERWEEVHILLCNPKNDAEKFRLAMRHNQRYGFNEDLKIAELAERFKEDLDLTQIKVDFANPVDLAYLLKSLSPPDTNSRESDEGNDTKTLDTFLSSAIRQIVLYFSIDQFEEIVPKLKAIADEHSYDNNTDVILHLMRFYEDNRE
jgi:hypothetical protein